MRIILFIVLFFMLSSFCNASNTCDKYDPLGGNINLFDWLSGEAPYQKVDFDEKSWQVDHLEVPTLNIPIAVTNHLSSKTLVKIKNEDVVNFMNSNLIKMPNINQNAYLVRGILYSRSGKIDAYRNPENNKLFIVHGSIHNSSLGKKENFMFQPIIVYLDDEPEMVNVALAAGSSAAFESLCGDQLSSK